MPDIHESGENYLETILVLRDRALPPLRRKENYYGKQRDPVQNLS